MTPVPNRGATGAPVSLADAAARIPQGDTRIRVERYTMPDGTRQFAVYVAGTRTMQPSTTDAVRHAGRTRSSTTGERSASYDATLAALADAGAEPGDVVHAFGHSQGAMVNAHVALEGGYDVQTLVSLGSPVEADVGDGTLSIALRHTRRSGDRARRRRSRERGRRARQLHRRAHGRPGARHARLSAARARHRRLHRDGAPAGRLGGSADGCGARAVRRTRLRGIVEITEYAAERVTSSRSRRSAPVADAWAAQSRFFGRRMMPKTQLMSEMMIAATTPHQKSSTRSPQLQKLVIQAVSHSRNALMMRPISPSVRM